MLVEVPGVTEKTMFGGLCFMVSGNMCCGILDDLLMARAGPGQYGSCLLISHAREMDFIGKPLKGMVYVDSEGFAEDAGLKDWIGRCLSFVKPCRLNSMRAFLGPWFAQDKAC